MTDTDSLVCQPDINEGILCPVEVVSAGHSFWWVGPLVLFCSFVSAGIFSWLSIASQRKIARQRATLDLIERSESSDYYDRIYEAFLRVRKGKTGLMSIRSQKGGADRKDVVNFLNHYELIALGIMNGTLDEEFYAKYFKKTFVAHWRDVEAFVEHVRDKTADSHIPRAYEHFEALAIKWAAEIERDELGTSLCRIDIDKNRTHN